MQKSESAKVAMPQRDSKGRFIKRDERATQAAATRPFGYVRVVREPLTSAQLNRKMKARSKNKRAKATRKANR